MLEVARWVTGGLILVNQVLSATIVLTSFSLFIYLLTHNFRSPVARAYCALLAFVLIVYVGDVVLFEVQNPEAAIRWLKFQWIGIAFVPAAYLHFSDALLATTNLRARWRTIGVVISYAASAVFLGLVLFSPWLVYDGVYLREASHLAPGRLFGVFVLYFALTVLWGAVNIFRARQRCLTRASRRRMTYMAMAFVGPALGVFPYMALASARATLAPNLLQTFVLIGNMATLAMIVLMAYSVAYFGALTPDRVVKHNLIHYLLRGPLVGAVVIFIMLAVPKVQQILGLPRDTVLIFAVVGAIVLLQLMINRTKPFIDQVIYRQDREEIAWIQTLDRRLLTTADLHSFLEDTLAALCDLLQVRTAFIAALSGGRDQVEAYCGDKATIQKLMEGRDLPALAMAIPAEEDDRFSAGDGFWLAPLYGLAGEAGLGVLGVEARAPLPDLAPDEKKIADLLIVRAQEALEDRYLQQGVFDTLRRILPDIELLHRWQDATRYAGSAPMQAIDASPIYSPEFQQWVRDALSHYWGGPKLTESPLLTLHVVGETAHEQGGNPAQALRTVLNRAIERLRPDGERKMAATEWTLYNILELRFIRGLRVHEVARRLAMSESDLYRKQRVAISEVARALAELEQNGAGHIEDNRQPALPATRGREP